MAIGKYIVHKAMSFNGVEYGLGMEIVLDQVDAESFVDTGKIVLQRYLDPTDSADAHYTAKLQPKELLDEEPLPVEEDKSNLPLSSQDENEEDSFEEEEDEEGPVDEETLG